MSWLSSRVAGCVLDSRSRIGYGTSFEGMTFNKETLRQAQGERKTRSLRLLRFARNDDGVETRRAVSGMRTDCFVAEFILSEDEGLLAMTDRNY